MHAFTRPRTRLAIAAAAAAGTVLAGTAITLSAHAATAGCSVTYTVTSQWPGGFGANVSITNLGDPVNGWTLTWSYAAGQRVTQAWNATVTQNGGQVTARNMSYNADTRINTDPLADTGIAEAHADADAVHLTVRRWRRRLADVPPEQRPRRQRPGPRPAVHPVGGLDRRARRSGLRPAARRGRPDLR